MSWIVTHCVVQSTFEGLFSPHSTAPHRLPHRTVPLTHRTTPHDVVGYLIQVLGDGSSLGTFTSSGTTLDVENWTINAADVSTIKLVARGLGYNDWLSITEARKYVYP